MADKFALDTDKAQDMSRRLASVAQGFDSIPSRPSSSGGSLGTGSLERALSEWDRVATAYKQSESQLVKGSSDAFSMTGKDVTTIDGDLAAEVERI